MAKRLTALSLAATLVVSAMIFTSVSSATVISAADLETVITLSDAAVKVDGNDASSSSADAVYVGADIVYYEAGHDSAYGEGTVVDEHSAEEAAAHTVVTITQAGTYRVSGKLTAGQLAVDLGSDASSDPSAVVTLILDGVDITCSVAPAVIFYNVYECGTTDLEQATATVDTSNAGANVILADGSKNYANGSYVARIYKEGTTKKLHKYDGAFYSKMSMNVSGESAGTGELHINAGNEGLDSELHLTVNGGKIYITADNDGVNTNEDGISVTTVNGGYLYVDAGLGVEGDGLDSNGYLVINGGTVISFANPRSGDGGIDADQPILLNGGTVIAFGSRNDAASTDSKQAYMEISYATTKAAGELVRIEDEQGTELLTFAPLKAYQSFTYSSPELKMGSTYHLYSGGSVSGSESTDGLYAKGASYSNGVQQQYTGNSFGMIGRMRLGGGRFNTAEGTENMDFPDGFPEMGERPEMPDGQQRQQRPEPPEGFDSSQWMQQPEGEAAEGSTEFTITETTRSFSGVSDSESDSDKTVVTFSINGGAGILNSAVGESITITDVQVTTKKDGTELSFLEGDIQVTVTDVPSEDYAESIMLSEGIEAVNDIMPTNEGRYSLTISVVSSNEQYTGTNQWQFVVGDEQRATLPTEEELPKDAEPAPTPAAEPSTVVEPVPTAEPSTAVESSQAGLVFTDVDTSNPYYNAIAYVYTKGLMSGTGNDTFAPSALVTRAMAISVLGRYASAESIETNNFSDVEQGSWYSGYVGWAVNNSIVSGIGNGLYAPNNSVTKQQMCVILNNYLKADGINITANKSAYADDAEIASWAADSVYTCQAVGLLDAIVSGNSLNPTAELTRAELAELLVKLEAVQQ